MNKPFDPTKPVQRRDGGTARILCTDALGYERPIIALHKGPTASEEMLSRFAADGTNAYSCGDPRDDDLVNVPERHVLWVNILGSFIASGCFRTKWDANNSAEGRQYRIACVRVEFEEGEGL